MAGLLRNLIAFVIGVFKYRSKGAGDAVVATVGSPGTELEFAL